jgi:cytochrome P450
MSTAPGTTNMIPLPFGHFGEFVREPLGFLLRARERYGDVFRMRIGPLLLHFLFHPDYVQHVLHDRPKNYLRGWQYHWLRRMMGENLVVSEGDYWLRQRRLAQPAFGRQRLALYAEVMVQATAEMLERWAKLSAGDTVDIGAEMSRLALHIAGLAFFSRDVSQKSDSVGRAFPVVGNYLVRRFNHPFTSPPAWVPTARTREFKRAVRNLNEIVFELVQRRRNEGRDYGDLLSMLMSATDEETGATMTDRQLSSEVLAFLLAGHETSATALTWTWYLLASHPTVQRRVRAEIQTVLGGRMPTCADVPQLNLTRMVIEEAMRLYPPIWATPRQVVTADEIGGFRIPARSMVVLCQFVTQRHPAIWESPETFDPDRFAPEKVKERSKYAHFPFLAGPHQCIGSEFAMLEMRLVVAMVLERFEIELLPNQQIEPKASIAIQPSAPVRLALKGMQRGLG